MQPNEAQSIDSLQDTTERDKLLQNTCGKKCALIFPPRAGIPVSYYGPHYLIFSDDIPHFSRAFWVISRVLLRPGVYPLSALHLVVPKLPLSVLTLVRCF